MKGHKQIKVIRVSVSRKLSIVSRGCYLSLSRITHRSGRSCFFGYSAFSSLIASSLFSLPGSDDNPHIASATRSGRVPDFFRSSRATSSSADLSDILRMASFKLRRLASARSPCLNNPPRTDWSVAPPKPLTALDVMYKTCSRARFQRADVSTLCQSKARHSRRHRD